MTLEGGARRLQELGQDGRGIRVEVWGKLRRFNEPCCASATHDIFIEPFSSILAFTLDRSYGRPEGFLYTPGVINVHRIVRSQQFGEPHYFNLGFRTNKGLN